MPRGRLFVGVVCPLQGCGGDGVVRRDGFASRRYADGYALDHWAARRLVEAQLEIDRCWQFGGHVKPALKHTVARHELEWSERVGDLAIVEPGQLGRGRLDGTLVMVQ